MDEETVVPIDANNLLSRAYAKIAKLEQRNDTLEEAVSVRAQQLANAMQTIAKYKAKFGELKDEKDASEQRTGD